MTYFFDNCISFRFADMLKALGIDTVALRHEQSEDIADVDLFEQLRGRQVVFVTTDRKQTNREHEARALKEAKVTALFFGPFWPKMRFWDQASWLVTKWPRISGFAEGVTKGTCAEIKRNGSALIIPV